MAEVAPAPVDPPATKPKKKAAPKPARNRNSPTVQDQIVKIVSASQERKGVSTAHLKKQLASLGYDVEKNKARIRLALKSLVKKEILAQASGVGASGSFKMAKKAGEAKAKKSATTSKPKPAKKAPSKAKAMKKVQSPKKAKASQASKKKASPKKVAKKATKAAPAKKAASVKTKKAVPPKSPKAKKPAPAKKAVAKKATKPKVKKAVTKK